MIDTVMIVTLLFVGLATLLCFGCVGVCLKIYTEMMKEHTIRRRYESQRQVN